MTEKDKLSKDVEKQIQSLANEVYIQVEEKLTQLICTITPKKAAEKINIEQEPVYIALQNSYQASQNELSEKSKNFSEKIHQLEQSTSTLKKQLDDERKQQANSDTTLKAHDADSAEKLAQLTQKNIELQQQLTDEIDNAEENELNFQVELTQNNINFTETIERLEHENTLLKSTLSQEQKKLEQSLSEQKNKFHQEQTQASVDNKKTQSELTAQQQEIVVLNEKLTAFTVLEQSLTERLNTAEQQCENSDGTLQKAEANWKKTEELQNQSLTEQKDKIEELTKQLNTSVNDLEHTRSRQRQQTTSFKQESEQKESQLSEQLKKSQVAEATQRAVVADQQTQLTDINEKINQLEIKNQDLTNNLITEQTDIKLYEKEIPLLKSQAMLAQKEYDNLLNRFNATREKQEKDNDQVRETIKKLRDENNDILIKNTKQQGDSIDKISELEHKLTEYRLKFEYAQKQLTQNS